MRVCLAKLTAPELVAFATLKEARVSFHSTGAGRYLPFHADFIIPSLKLAIYIDGCYWHACPRHFPDDPAASRRRLPSRQADRARSRQVRLAEWTPVRIWECQQIHKILIQTLSRERRRLRSIA
jgi:DNA mismatch endonuclease (patch repair protein)